MKDFRSSSKNLGDTPVNRQQKLVYSIHLERLLLARILVYIDVESATTRAQDL